MTNTIIHKTVSRLKEECQLTIKDEKQNVATLVLKATPNSLKRYAVYIEIRSYTQ